MPALSQAVEAAVERHWVRACRDRPLFNGRVFSADHVTPDLIVGHWTEYRRVLAQMTDPSLRPALRVRSLSVCGALLGPDGVVVGRREAASVYQAGLWQLPPAGSVDDGCDRDGVADLRHALLAELQEELGVGAEAVLSLRPLCLVDHPNGVLDIGFQIDTSWDAEAILAAHQRVGNREYERLIVLPPREVAAHLAAMGEALVPSAGAFLTRVG
ncbi:MAG: NUDIX hydrolase [Gemmatimonadaceae bacterium]|nr:NUDIX hydrolase [Acetobacteraceae bacterium]